jgi:hypothetical protein
MSPAPAQVKRRAGLLFGLNQAVEAPDQRPPLSLTGGLAVIGLAPVPGQDLLAGRQGKVRGIVRPQPLPPRPKVGGADTFGP